MAAKGTRDELYDVSDPSDWLPTPLKHFSDVESALRCQVCKDFFTTPMITSCSHTFCSLCIRRCLVNDGKCPACRAPEQELKLRSNAVLEGIVEAFQRARPVALDFARSQSEIDHTSSPKRKLDIHEMDIENPRKRTRSSNRITTRQRQGGEIADVQDNSDDDYQPGGSITNPLHDTQSDLLSRIKEDNLVACPICGTRMKIELINPHLDRCTGEPSKAPPTVNTMTSAPPQKPSKPPERLPQLSYSLFKEAALRKKLMELGISAAGNRPLLERRHTEWVTLWNANCDSSKPRRKTELLHDLEVWERTQGSRAPLQNNLSMASEIRSKDFDGPSWSAKHDDSFQNLIQSARRQVATKRQLKSSGPEPTMNSNNGGGEVVRYKNNGLPIAAETLGESPVVEECADGSLPLQSAIEKRANGISEEQVESKNLLSPVTSMRVVLPPSPRKEDLQDSSCLDSVTLAPTWPHDGST